MEKCEEKSMKVLHLNRSPRGVISSEENVIYLPRESENVLFNTLLATDEIELTSNLSSYDDEQDLHNLLILYSVKVRSERILDQAEIANREWALFVRDRSLEEWVQVNALSGSSESATILRIEYVPQYVISRE